MNTILKLHDLNKSYGGKRIVRDLSLEVKSGEFFSLLGPSGCGKSTTLRMISGFEKPDSGQVLSRGQNITLQPVRKRDFNMVFQNYALFPHMNVFANVAFGLQMLGHRRSEVRREAMEALCLVKMDAFAESFPAQLSGGQQQRVALARAIAPKPSLLLLDEPLGALDQKLRREMQLELKHLQRRLHIAFIFVTHDQEEAMALSDRMAIMDHGRILQLGNPRELYDQPASRDVAAFLGEADFFTLIVEPAAGGVCGVCTVTGMRMPLADDRPWRPGERAVVPVRPEYWEVGVGEGRALMRGEVSEVIYRGRDVAVIVRGAGGREIQAICAPGQQLTPGDPVTLGLKPTFLRALPGEEPR